MAHLLSHILLLFVVVSLHVNVIAQENEPNIILPGSTLYAGKHPRSWPSPSGHFEFGFYRQGGGYAAGIWLVGRPENTTVWTANRNDPPVSASSTLEFTAQGTLLLRTENGAQKIIANTSSSGFVYSACMLDMGNFVLYQNRSVVWESFDFPTDTILGGQNLTRDHNQLISSVSRSNHAGGQFLLIMQTDGNLVAYVNNSAELDTNDAYWSTRTNGYPFSVLNLNTRGVLTISSESDLYGEWLVADGSTTGNQTMIIYRASLDPDGIFRLYSHQLEKNTISNIWQNVDDACDVNGHCGLNSYCSSKGDDFGCYCYPGFTSESTKIPSCSQNFTLDGCESRKDLLIQYNITTLENMEWAGDPYSVKHNLDKEECKKACEEDCSCGGVLYSIPNCNMFRLPLKYGKRHENINTTAFIKVIVGSSSEIRPTLINESNRSLILTVGLSLGSVASLSFVMALCSFLLYRHRVKSYEKISENTSQVLTEQFTLRSFTFNELDEATHGFDDELGRGSFGVVYKGILPGDGKSIVVKRLPKVNEGETDRIRTEMIVIGRTNHRNLVRLLGFCVEGSRKLLVYEYLSNGSLADFLFNMNGRPAWKERARIALDVAKGILYLHEECEACIIHCNLKPHNILLDDSLTAKISDFGLAKLLRPNHTRSTTGTKGTEWYSAPERQSSASVSEKVDVYSFGVILLEIICCRSNIEVQVCSADEILLSTWVYNCFVGGELNKLVEGEEEVDMRMVERFVKVGLWCIQDDPTSRPLMKNVTMMLEGTMNVPIPPSPSLPMLLLN
ncbi:G-type lectin S-receptor-like serine/threonine-protein kinase RLK1-like [Hibiscus syriacus]|uniref:Receptor-like serine/threonine-protein kinase n=1 Tax=Hibiscus syriacus TaxID=106335 RepID=A0A6A3AU26_HIBSY|nr:G-type lectin S-receptor-like serine/threonine-protein kinase LECRK1 [Hibiscus syriacus]KAE8706897.1 G-type lectin S-receptor-like serine/threonine-protein kinase RLK1-like [Hibiscus syriacus]